MKRLFDLVVSIILLVLFGPLMLFVALLISLESRGGALFRQTRIGLGCQPFTILKFRSMVAGADKKGSYQTADNDARITKMGKIIRKTSLDELPQLINVVRGEMSLVGPRPDTPAQESNYAPDEWKARHAVRPGITGLAQATLRSSATHEQRLALDLQYAGQNSVGGDIGILWQTVKSVLGRPGAN